MKCELCHQAEAQTAIVRGEGAAAEELYVCNACAKAERLRHQKKSQRTRKVMGLPPGVEMSITEIRGSGEGGDEERPPFIDAIFDAIKDMASNIGATVSGRIEAGQEASSKDQEKYKEISLVEEDADFRIGARLHLEALHLIGELEAVRRAFHALRMDLTGVTADGVVDVGHIYSLRSAANDACTRRVVRDLVREERNARVRLYEEQPRVLGDAICRALAILKNCRMLSPGEFFDLLSPLRLVAKENLLDGITYEEINRIMLEIDLSNAEDRLEQDMRDKVDAMRADEMNKRFEDVVLNERAEERFL